MYESPIEIIYGEIETQLEGEVLKATQRVGVNVNKEELLKALQYDREQYLKGYEDGLNANRWIPCSERLPKSEDKYGWVKCNVTVMRSHWPTSSYDPCDSPYDEYIVTDAMYDVCQKIWHLGDSCQLNALINIEDSPLNGDYVVAWMPLPEPYKGE